MILFPQAVQKLVNGSLDLNLLFAPLMSMANRGDNFIVDNPHFFSKLSHLILTKWSWGGIYDFLLIKTLKRSDDD